MPPIADGDSAKAKAARARTIEASYSIPRKVTNPLEPINVIVCARNGGTPAHRVTLHERLSGGSLGAHESTYWLFEATGCAVKAGRPVKLTNTRKHGAVKMEKLTCVADCGSAVSPAGGDEQRYGGLMWGLGHATADCIDFRHGRVQRSNFDTYRVMWISDMRATDIHIVPGDPAKPGGIDELSIPAVTPVIANAVFRLTGTRLWETPFDLSAIAQRA